jgi:hypothetical protein
MKKRQNYDLNHYKLETNVKIWKLHIRDSSVCENILWIKCGGCLARSASICRMDSSGMSRLSSILARCPSDQRNTGIRVNALDMPINPPKIGKRLETTTRIERHNAKAAKEGEKGYSSVATHLGAKEWMNVYPSRRQLLLVRR